LSKKEKEKLLYVKENHASFVFEIRIQYSLWHLYFFLLRSKEAAKYGLSGFADS